MELALRPWGLQDRLLSPPGTFWGRRTGCQHLAPWIGALGGPQCSGPGPQRPLHPFHHGVQGGPGARGWLPSHQCFLLFSTHSVSVTYVKLPGALKCCCLVPLLDELRWNSLVGDGSRGIICFSRAGWRAACGPGTLTCPETKLFHMELCMKCALSLWHRAWLCPR